MLANFKCPNCRGEVQWTENQAYRWECLECPCIGNLPPAEVK